MVVLVHLIIVQVETVLAALNSEEMVSLRCQGVELWS